MKKLLALILALVMVMGLATVGTNAAAQYSDEDDFNFEEAIDVMSAIGVLEGADGKFRPSVELKRSEAAKIVAYLNTNNRTAEGLLGVGKFSDVPTNHWAAGYIDYLTSIGVIAGQSESSFNPDGDLTAIDFAKMLLVVIGYDPKIEGLVGSDYQIYTSKLATQAGLFKGLKDLNANDVLTREQAAQMAFNTIKAATVEYKSKGGEISVNGASINIGSSDATYVTTTIARDQNIDDRKLTNATGVAADSGYTVEFGERQYPSLKQDKYALDGFKRPVNRWTNGKVEIGEYIDPDTVLGDYTTGVTGADLLELIGEAKLKNAETSVQYAVNGYIFKYATPEDVKASLLAGDGKYKGFELLGVDKSNMIRGNKVAYGFTGNGVLTEVFERNNVFYVTSILTYYVQATDDYNTTNGTVTYDLFTADTAVAVGGAEAGKPAGAIAPTFDGQREDNSKISAVDYPEVKDLTKNEGFLVRFFYNDSRKWEVGEIELKPQTKADQTITKFSVSYDKKTDGSKNSDGTDQNAFYKGYVVAGSQYDFSRAVFLDRDLRGYSEITTALDNTYDLVFDQYDYLIAAIQKTAPSKYLFLTGIDSKNSNIASAQVNGFAIFSDGTTANITIDRNKTNENIAKNTGAANLVNGGNVAYYALNPDVGHAYNRWFSYTTSGEGSSAIYTLTPVWRSQIVGFDHQEHETVDTDGVMRVRFSAARTRVVGDYSLEYTRGKRNDSAKDDLPNGEAYSTANPVTATAANNGVPGKNFSQLNENSTIMTVKVAKTSATKEYINANYDFGIAEVTGIYNGILNTDIVSYPQMNAKTVSGANTKISDYSKANPFKAVAWAIYNANNYVTHMIVVGEDNGSSKSFLYATSGARNERKDGKYYYWDFDAIVDGERKTVTVKSEYNNYIIDLNTRQNFAPDTFNGNAFFEAKFDKDGYATSLTAQSFGTASGITDTAEGVSGVYKTDDMKAGNSITKDHVAFSVYSKGSTTVRAIGQTLYFDVDGGNSNNGLVVQSGAPIFVVQQYQDINTSQKSTVVNRWSSLEAALGDVWGRDDANKSLSQAGSRSKIVEFKGFVAAALDKSSSTAKWVVIKSTGLPVNVESNKNPGLTTSGSLVTQSVPKGLQVTLTNNAKFGTNGSVIRITYEILGGDGNYRKAGDYTYACQADVTQIVLDATLAETDTNSATGNPVTIPFAKYNAITGATTYRITFEWGSTNGISFTNRDSFEIVWVPVPTT